MPEISIRHSQQLDVDTSRWPLRLFCYRPPGDPPQGGFPVIYGLDGNAHFLSLVGSMRANSFRPDLTGLDPAVIVGIGYPIDGDLAMDQRIHDYTPQVDRTTLWPRPNGLLWPETGGADWLIETIETSIKPVIEAQYPIDRTRQSLYGHSFGGLFTLYTAFTRPNLYARFLASSPSIWFGDSYLTKLEAEFAGKLAELDYPLDMMISVGSREDQLPPGIDPRLPKFREWVRANNMVANARAMAARLSALPVDRLRLHFREFEDENHGSASVVSCHRAMILAMRRREKTGVQ